MVVRNSASIPISDNLPIDSFTLGSLAPWEVMFRMVGDNDGVFGVLMLLKGWSYVCVAALMMLTLALMPRCHPRLFAVSLCHRRYRWK